MQLGCWVQSEVLTDMTLQKSVENLVFPNLQWLKFLTCYFDVVMHLGCGNDTLTSLLGVVTSAEDSPDHT